MESAGISRIVILTRPSAKQALVARYGTEGQTRFAMAQSARGATDFARAVHEDDAQTIAVRRIRDAIPADIKIAEISRAMVAQFLFAPDDLVVAVGQDGLVANAGKYLDGQPLAGVNPDPGVIDGSLLAFDVPNFIAALPEALQGKRPHREATLAEAATSDRQTLRGLNEIFVGVPNHQSARYRIRFGREEEVQSSSGLIIATGTGATGWMRSIMGDGEKHNPAAPTLRFAVREAWPGKGFGATITRGTVTAAEPLVIESRMDEGIMFADGIEADGVRFDAGVSATIRPSARRVRLML